MNDAIAGRIAKRVARKKAAEQRAQKLIEVAQDRERCRIMREVVRVQSWRDKAERAKDSRARALAKQRAGYRHRTYLVHDPEPEGWQARAALVPDHDPRTITGRIFGDPIPGDRRRM